MKFFLICLLISGVIIGNKHDEVVTSAITYELNGGRFGDNLLSYSRAKWLSYIYGIPLQLYPFPYADQLELYEREPMVCFEQFNHVVRLPASSNYTLKPNNNTLYINHWHVPVKIDWNEPFFVAELKELISPRYEIEKVTIPQGYISIAVHVRTGGGFGADTPQEQERCPLRFVPDEFFIEQIRRIAFMFPEKALYIYIFTDHKNPSQLAEKYSNALQGLSLVFDYQKNENAHNLNVLEDFFSMMQFDCLIRPGSHFSRFVERLGEAQLVIYPYSYKKVGKESIIDVVGIKTRTSKGWKTVKEVIA